MMKMTLMIEGSASVLAAILASLPDGAAVASPNVGGPGSVSLDTNGAITGFTPMPSNPTGGDDDDADDSGPVNTAAPATDVNGLPWNERIHAATKSTNADGSWKKRKGGPKGEELAKIEAELRTRAAPPMPPAVVPIAPPIPASVPMPAPVPVGMTPPNAAPVPPPPPVAAPIPPAMPAPAPMASDVPAATTAVSAPPMPPVAPMPAPAPVAAAPQTPPAAAIETAASAATGTLDFAQFMQHISGQMQKKDGAGAPLVHADYLAQIAKEISDAWAPHGHPPLQSITDINGDPQKITYAMQLMQRDGRW